MRQSPQSRHVLALSVVMVVGAIETATVEGAIPGVVAQGCILAIAENGGIRLAVGWLRSIGLCGVERD